MNTEMESVDFHNTSILRENRTSIKIRLMDIEKARNSINLLHGDSCPLKQEFFLEALKTFDITQIDT